MLLLRISLLPTWNLLPVCLLCCVPKIDHPRVYQFHRRTHKTQHIVILIPASVNSDWIQRRIPKSKSTRDGIWRKPGSGFREPSPGRVLKETLNPSSNKFLMRDSTPKVLLGAVHVGPLKYQNSRRPKESRCSAETTLLTQWATLLQGRFCFNVGIVYQWGPRMPAKDEQAFLRTAVSCLLC